jgi:hypothetical protein
MPSLALTSSAGPTPATLTTEQFSAIRAGDDVALVADHDAAAVFDPFRRQREGRRLLGKRRRRHRRAQRLHDGFYRHVVDQAEAAKLAFPDRSTNIKISQTLRAAEHEAVVLQRLNSTFRFAGSRFMRSKRRRASARARSAGTSRSGFRHSPPSSACRAPLRASQSDGGAGCRSRCQSRGRSPRARRWGRLP